MVNAITTTATNNWSSGIVITPRRTCVVLCTIGRGGACCGVVLYRRMMVACRNTKTPTDATTLARGGAWRSGLKIRKCSSSPSSTQKASEMRSAGQKPKLDPSEIETGRFGVLKVGCFWKRWTRPSMGFSGFGSGGKNS
jgi:hypothetical protein